MKGKYIVIRSPFFESPILFSEGQGHNDLVFKDRIISAGFFRVWFEKGICKVGCWGQSDSLNIKSRGKEDALLIKAFMREEYDEIPWEIV